jgi:hypothetical protein
MLKGLQLSLEARHTILPDISKELMAISRKIADFTNEWCPETSRSQARESRTATTHDDIFVMNCPELHPVPGKVLLRCLEEDSSVRSQQEFVCWKYKATSLVTLTIFAAGPPTSEKYPVNDEMWPVLIPI